jgi:hypothetical protein
VRPAPQIFALNIFLRDALYLLQNRVVAAISILRRGENTTLAAASEGQRKLSSPDC